MINSFSEKSLVKYRATIILPSGDMTKYFSNVCRAAEWLDSQNNNLKHTTIISELDNKGNVIDGFLYTKETG
jgi:hypothetical protein